MVIKTIPENLWEEYSKQSSGKSKDEVETILNELFSDECNNLTEVTVRQLQGGKFGAHLFLASYTASQNTRKDWVIKFVEPKKIHLIQKERHAIEKLVNKIQPGVKIRVSVNGAIAYPFIKSEFNFDDLLLEASFSPPSIFYQQLFIYPEYPKGGMEYHETINERAIRELPLTHFLIFCGIRKKFHTK